MSLISQARLKNNSWYHKWLKATGNRLYDLENQIAKTDPSIYQADYSMMEDHYHDLAQDSSVVHFYFDDLYKEKETAFEAPPPMGRSYYIEIETNIIIYYICFAVPHFEELTHFWIGFIVAMMLHYLHKVKVRFLLPFLPWFRAAGNPEET